MAEKPLLKDLCKSNKGGNSYRKIAELSGVPENTVNNFFSSASKDPSIYTAGPICRVCGVSLDEYFGIEITESREDERRIELLERDNASLRRENELLERVCKQSRRTMAANDRLIYCLIFVAAMTIVALVPYMHMDISNPDIGIWRGGPSVVGAVIIVALTAGVAVTVYLFVVSRKERREK